MLHYVFAVTLCAFVVYIFSKVIEYTTNPLRQIAGPRLRNWIGNVDYITHPTISPRMHDLYVKSYGRSIRVRGLGPFDERLLTLDPVSVAHVLKNSTLYEKPWQSRMLITQLIGCGLLASEGMVHKRQRRVATPAFSIQNLRALVPIVYRKGNELKNRWLKMVKAEGGDGMTIDVCHWVSRATFDVIGLAGFDYDFNAIENEFNELFLAYKDMFETAISQNSALRVSLGVYIPWLMRIFPDDISRTVARCHEVIHRVAGQLIQEKKRKIIEGEEKGIPYVGKDLLSLLLKSNVAADLAPENRISDEDILNNINTFMFAGSDTSSLAVTWMLYLLSENLELQTRLRKEILSIVPSADPESLSDDEILSLFTTISELPFLNNVTRESLRLIPPIHSSLREAMQDDVIPTSYPVYKSDLTIDESQQGLFIRKGTFVHVAIEGFNLDKGIWGEDAWVFNPDRWDNLPQKVQEQPGLYSNTLTFSAGPRSCIGMRFSLIEIKTFLYILIQNFIFSGSGDKIFKANVVLTRPYICKKFKEGSQCPLHVSLYVPHHST